MVFVPDHQVHRQAFLSPVGVGLHQLAHQFDLRRVVDLHQNDGQVPGNSLTPKARLIAQVAAQHAAFSAQSGVGVHQRGSHLFIQAGICGRGVELAQQHLAVGPGQVEDPVSQIAVAVFADQLQAAFAAAAQAGNQVDAGRLPGVEADPAADRHYRVEHRAGTVGQ